MLLQIPVCEWNEVNNNCLVLQLMLLVVCWLVHLPSTPARCTAGRPAELPVPYHGSAQYSHQLHENTATPPGLTPTASGRTTHSKLTTSLLQSILHKDGQLCTAALCVSLLFLWHRICMNCQCCDFVFRGIVIHSMIQVGGGAPTTKTCFAVAFFCLHASY